LKIVVATNNETIIKNIKLKEQTLNLDEVIVTTTYDGSTEAGARGTEKNAATVVNAISAKTIESSPDITVANVIQRVSGLTIERNANGDGQYAIVRGMNKRYNYTLVNGIKIPSPDNENRYVPLDIFPAELLDQLIVSKSLTPDMEGDAIGGVVDMRMKDAPSKRMFTANVSSGFNTLFLERPYDYFNYRAVDFTPPMQRLPQGQRVANVDQFSTENLNFEQRSLSANPFSTQNLTPNRLAAVTYGDRYRNGKLGIVIAGSYQNTFRGADRIEFGISDNTFGAIRPRLSRYQERAYSSQQERSGVHSKLDYQINSRNKIRLYNAWLRMGNYETRTILEDGLRDAGNEKTLEQHFRGQVNVQQIYNSTLQGEHVLSNRFTADWSLVYSYAQQEMPDNSQVITVSNYNTPDRSLRWLMWENIIRIWESNSDQDLAGYYNLNYNVIIAGTAVKLKTGGLYRAKRRENFFDLYTFKPNPGEQEYVPFTTDYADLTWRITGGSGTPSHVLNYQSYEDILAQYGQASFQIGNTQVLGGVRFEHTDQGYTTANNNIPDGNQEYWSVLPSLHLKHMPTNKINIRSSYFKSLSRPSFLEIIPYRRPSVEEIVPMGGNPNLVAVEAHNFDMRFELFPNALDQFLVGAFYKIINNPIENAILPATDPQFPQFLPTATTMVPINLQTAINRGIEVDFIKYYKKFGIRANYTFTDSEIESVKRTFTEITEDNIGQLTPLQLQTIGIGDSTFLNVNQSRPLQGQSRHIGNLSLLYKDSDRGWNLQLSMVFTGERIAVVSAGLDTDWWQRDFTQLDFSMEKRFGEHWHFFLKVNNLLNEPFELFIKQPHMPQVGVNELQPNGNVETLVRRDFYHRNILFGVRYTL
ncbi:MAG: TonB-dependent receptor, partial [Schleiferiaceae bacterium]|nr:TonB-dependent receptor [Schleiferiaceae bacterium]